MKKFDFNTITDFDDHILKSIPNYDILIMQIKSMSDYFVINNKHIYDFGCSSGKLLKALPYPNLKIGYDNSNLLPESTDSITFDNVDLNGKFEINDACIAYSIFTMQFLETTSKEGFLGQIYNGLIYGGALFLCEKVYQQNGMIQELITFSHYDYKCNHFTEEEIIAKERDLRFIMHLNTLIELITMLKAVKFRIIEQFWQCYNFVGIIAVK